MTTTRARETAPAWAVEILDALDEISGRLAAFEALLEKYRPALEVLEQRVGRATKTRWYRGGANAEG